MKILLLLAFLAVSSTAHAVIMSVGVNAQWEGHWNLSIGSYEAFAVFGYGNHTGHSVTGVSGASQTFRWSPNSDFSAPVYSAYVEVRDNMRISLYPDGSYVVVVEGDPGGEPEMEYTSEDLTFTLLLSFLCIWALRSGIQDGAAPR